MSDELRIDIDGQVRLGDAVIPGVYQGLQITGKLRIDEVRRPGRSGSGKLPEGWEDFKARLRVVLLPHADEEVYPVRAIEEISALYRAAKPPTGKPLVYRVVHPVFAAMGIRDVLFTSIDIQDWEDGESTIAELELQEYQPVAVKREKRRPNLRKKFVAEVGEGGLDVLLGGADIILAKDPAAYAAEVIKAKAALGTLAPADQLYATLPTPPPGAAVPVTFEHDVDVP